SESSPVVGRRADVVAAAHYAAETIIRMLKPGTNTLDITDAVQKVSQSFGCNPLQSMLSYEQRQNVLEGETQIIFNPIPEQRGEFKKYVIGDNEVYMIDIYMTTGSGKTTKSSIRTTVFKKNEGKPQLRMKAAISLYNEVKSKFGSYPFTTRSIEDERKARSGVLECVKSGLLEPFEVYEDKPEEIVAQLTFTALVQAKGTERITTGGPEFDPNVVKSDKSITDEELLKLLATSVRAKKSKSKKKGSKKSAAADTLEQPKEGQE
ncbi:Proliferation-associated protein 2G4, partial [Spiromyces aspiralis]